MGCWSPCGRQKVQSRGLKPAGTGCSEQAKGTRVACLGGNEFLSDWGPLKARKLTIVGKEKVRCHTAWEKSCVLKDELSKRSKNSGEVEKCLFIFNNLSWLMWRIIVLRDPWEGYASYGINITTDSQVVKGKMQTPHVFMRCWGLNLKEGIWGQGQLLAMAEGRDGDQKDNRRGSPAFSLVQWRLMPGIIKS